MTRAIELQAEARRCWLRWQQVREDAQRVSDEAMRLIVTLRQQRICSRLREKGWSVAPFLPPWSLPAAASRGGAAPASLAPAEVGAISPSPLAAPAPPAIARVEATDRLAGALESKAMLAATAAAEVATAVATETIAALAKLTDSDLGMVVSPVEVAHSLLPAAREDYDLRLVQAWAALRLASEEFAAAALPSGRRPPGASPVAGRP